MPGSAACFVRHLPRGNTHTTRERTREKGTETGRERKEQRQGEKEKGTETGRERKEQRREMFQMSNVDVP